LPGRSGVWIVVASVAIGLLLTLLAGGEPGWLLGAFLIVGTVSAVLSVRPTAAHLIIPVPAFAYLVGAMIAGYVHDRGVDTSHTALAVSAVQWIAGGFFWMTAATLLAIAATAARNPRRLRGRGVPARRRQAARPARRPPARPTDWY
jgi:hypothetical protein